TAPATHSVQLTTLRMYRVCLAPMTYRYTPAPQADPPDQADDHGKLPPRPPRSIGAARGQPHLRDGTRTRGIPDTTSLGAAQLGPFRAPRPADAGRGPCAS